MDDWKRNKIRKSSETVYNLLKPFGVTDIDYYFEEGSEYLRIGRDVICCTSNSESAIVDEVVKWLMVRRKIYMGVFHTQTTNELKKYWKKENE